MAIVISIEIEFTGSLFDRMTDADVQSINRDATEYQYEALLSERLGKDYPDAVVSIKHDTGHVTTKIWLEASEPLTGQEEDCIREDIQRTYEQVFEEGRFYIEAEDANGY